jgi:hypothetical protein
MLLEYKIDNEIIDVDVSDNQNYITGESKVLSNKDTDITFNQNWYSEGYTTAPFLWNEEFDDLKKGITNTISDLLTKEGIDTTGFTLEKYHKYVKTNEQHFSIVSKTRDLFPEQFSFNIRELMPTFSNLLGFKLSDINPKTNDRVHIIVRINRPNSSDYNPPHKDMYEAYDREGYFPQFVNFWIPIAGVTNKTSLPIVPKSHLISEDNVVRTSDGGIVGGNKYRVRFIKEWGDNSMIRTNVSDSEVLIFSSHLIHGLAKNGEDDITRVALEFRLFKK